jgi:uncharacterized protein YbjT (DUF2867 family)
VKFRFGPVKEVWSPSNAKVVRLPAAQDRSVRAVSRHAHGGGFPDGVEAVAGDMTDVADVARVLDGVDRAF